MLIAETGFRWSELALAGSARSLFAARKLLEIRVPSGKPGVEGGAALQAYCAMLPPDTVTLVQLPGLDWRTQKSAWFEALASTGVAVEACVVSRTALPQWLAGRLKAHGREVDRETLELIAERVEGNLMAAWQEVQKLTLLFPPGPISREQVRGAVLDVARYDVFALGEVMLQADPLRLYRMIDGLRAEGVAPPLALWALTDATRALGKVIAGAAAGRPLQSVMREAGIRNPALHKVMRAQSARHTPASIAQALRHAAAIDRMIKGLARGDVWDELLQLGLRFSDPKQAQAPRASRTGSALPADP
jgi:DNA polymerase III subunit delta